MKPFERLRQAAQVFRAIQPDKSGWFDSSTPDCLEGERLLELGHAASAEELFARAVADPRQRSRSRRQQSRVLMALATAQLRQAKLAEAERNALDAQALLDEPKASAWGETSDCIDLLGRIAHQQGELSEAEARFRRALDLLRGRKEAPAADVSAVLRRLGGVLKERGDTDAAFEQLQEAVEVARNGCGARSAALADALMDLSHAEAGRKRYDEARQLASQALEIHRATSGGDSGDAARDLEALAQFSRSANDMEAAVTYLEQALFVRERQIGGNSTELALLMVTLANIHTTLGRLAPALELMQQAVGKLTPAHDENFAGAMEKLGAIYVRTGRPEDAYDCYRTARQVWEGHPEQHAEALSANSNVLAQLESSLPAIEAPQIKEDPDQPGVSVLLPDGPCRPIPNAEANGSAPLKLVPGVRPGNAAQVAPAPIPAGSPRAAELQHSLTTSAYPVMPPSQLRPAKPEVVEMPAPVVARPAQKETALLWQGWEDLAFDLLAIPEHR